METKECIDCKEVKTLYWFEFRNDTQKYRNKCCVCRAKSRGHTSRKVIREERNNLIDSGFKVCGKCKHTKSLDNYNLDKYMPNGYTSWCKACKKDYGDSNPDVLQNAKLRKYGLDVDSYKAMRESQKNRCVICTNPFEEARNIHVDHCHTTGKTRELLCNNCNFLLGHSKDNILILKSAIRYLEKHNK